MRRDRRNDLWQFGKKSAIGQGAATLGRVGDYAPNSRPFAGVPFYSGASNNRRHSRPSLRDDAGIGESGVGDGGRTPMQNAKCKTTATRNPVWVVSSAIVRRSGATDGRGFTDGPFVEFVRCFSVSSVVKKAVVLLRLSFRVHRLLTPTCAAECPT